MPRRSRLLAVAVLLGAAWYAYSGRRGGGAARAAGHPAPVAASATLAGAPVTARAQIDAANVRYATALTTGDTAMLGALYADDAILMDPGMKALRGRAEFMPSLAWWLASGRFTDVALVADDVMTGGDLAVETGHFAWTFTPRGGKPTREVGKYVEVWKRQPDGNYRAVREIENADPAPTK